MFWVWLQLFNYELVKGTMLFTSGFVFFLKNVVTITLYIRASGEPNSNSWNKWPLAESDWMQVCALSAADGQLLT